MISEIETALVDFVGGCLPAEVDVAPGPGEWDESYTRNLLTSLPAVRVVFDTAAQITSESFILLESSWVIFIAVGWKGGDEASRRVGSNGAYRFLDVLVPALHKVHLADATGKKITLVEVERVENMWTPTLSASGMALYAIGISAQIEFELDPAASKSRLDDFLKAGVGFRLPDDPDADLPEGGFDLPQ